MASIDLQPTLRQEAPPIPRDLKHVALTEDVEVQYWSKRFRTSRHLLEEAVEHVGHSVNAVADYLERRR